jgi:predicted flap endonuclease-1-like 5' DNA nuclease
MSLTKKYSKSKPVCKVTFSLPKEAVNGGKEVRVLGEFNDWKWENGTKMKAQKEAFKATIELEAGKNYQFRYLIDNVNWENDWNAEAYFPTPYGVENSVVFVDEVSDVPAKPKAKATPKAKTTTTKTATKTTAKKTTKTAAKKVVKDSLRKIEGIGPKIEGLLNAAGVVTFNDLAKAKLTLLKQVLADAGSRYKMHDPTTWSEQAKLAAKGEWDKLKTLQDELKGGKR